MAFWGANLQRMGGESACFKGNNVDNSARIDKNGRKSMYMHQIACHSERTSPMLSIWRQKVKIGIKSNTLDPKSKQIRLESAKQSENKVKMRISGKYGREPEAR